MKIKVKRKTVKLEDLQAGEVFKFVKPVELVNCFYGDGRDDSYYLMTDLGKDEEGNETNDFVDLKNGRIMVPDPGDGQRAVYAYPNAYMVIPKDELE